MCDRACHDAERAENARLRHENAELRGALVDAQVMVRKLTTTIRSMRKVAEERGRRQAREAAQV